MLSKPALICTAVYLTVMAAALCVCSILTMIWIDSASRGSIYPTAFMNQVSTDWSAPTLTSLQVSQNGSCKGTDFVFARIFYGSMTACDCLGVTSSLISKDN